MIWTTTHIRDLEPTQGSRPRQPTQTNLLATGGPLRGLLGPTGVPRLLWVGTFGALETCGFAVKGLGLLYGAKCPKYRVSIQNHSGVSEHRDPRYFGPAKSSSGRFFSVSRGFPS